MFNMNRTMDFITILDAVKGEQIFETDEDAKIYLTNLALQDRNGAALSNDFDYGDTWL